MRRSQWQESRKLREGEARDFARYKAQRTSIQDLLYGESEISNENALSVQCGIVFRQRRTDNIDLRDRSVFPRAAGVWS